MSRASLDKKPAEVAAMFDVVAERYDLTNDVLTGGIDRYWRRAVVAEVAAIRGETVLDIAAGTGTSSVPFADAGVQVVPADFSLGMLAHGRRRRPDLAFTAADATRLPFADESFDAVTMSFGLRNVVDVAGALAQFRRVTKRGGRIVVAEFSRPTNPVLRTLYRRGALRVLPVIASRVSSDPQSYVYLAESIQAWPDQNALAQTMRDAGWAGVEWRDLTGGIVALHRAVRLD